MKTLSEDTWIFWGLFCFLIEAFAFSYVFLTNIHRKYEKRKEITQISQIEVFSPPRKVVFHLKKDNFIWEQAILIEKWNHFTQTTVKCFAILWSEQEIYDKRTAQETFRLALIICVFPVRGIKAQVLQ